MQVFDRMAWKDDSEIPSPAWSLRCFSPAIKLPLLRVRAESEWEVEPRKLRTTKSRSAGWEHVERRPEPKVRTLHYNGVVTEVTAVAVFADIYLLDGDVQPARLPREAFRQLPCAGDEVECTLTIQGCTTTVMARILTETERKAIIGLEMTESELRSWVDTIDV